MPFRCAKLRMVDLPHVRDALEARGQVLTTRYFCEESIGDIDPFKLRFSNSVPRVTHFQIGFGNACGNQTAMMLSKLRGSALSINGLWKIAGHTPLGSSHLDVATP